MQPTISPRQMPTHGFTLIEVMITLVIISVLASIAIPAYGQYVARGRVADGVGMLSSLRLQTEQNYQDDRTYANAGACTVAAPANTYFTYTCSDATTTTYTWTAKSKADAGLGSADAYVYTIDENGNQKTLAYEGHTLDMNCWQTSGSTAC